MRFFYKKQKASVLFTNASVGKYWIMVNGGNHSEVDNSLNAYGDLSGTKIKIIDGTEIGRKGNWMINLESKVYSLNVPYHIIKWKLLHGHRIWHIRFENNITAIVEDYIDCENIKDASKKVMLKGCVEWLHFDVVYYHKINSEYE